MCCKREPFSFILLERDSHFTLLFYCLQITDIQMKKLS